MDKQNNPLNSLAKFANTGKKFPALNIVRDRPEIAAMISKLVEPRDTRVRNITKGRDLGAVNQNQFAQISENLKTKLTDSETTMQLFPDMELAAQILVSSILSPKDMVNTDIVYKAEEANLPSELVAKMIEIIRENVDKHHKFKAELPSMLRDVLFESGSYIKAVIPESSVDELINNNQIVSTESVSNLIGRNNRLAGLGILGPGTLNDKPQSANNQSRTMVGLESFDRPAVAYQDFEVSVGNSHHSPQDRNSKPLNLNVEVTDNFQLLKLPRLIETNRNAKVKNAIASATRIGFESVSVGSKDMKAALYKGPNSQTQLFVAIKDRKATKRKSIGRPLVLRLPTEATIPVHVPGDEKSHIGYFVLVDAEGNPVTRTSNQEYLSNLVSQPTEMSGMTSSLLARAKKNLTSNDQKNMTVDQAAQIYADIVEADLTERLKNGVYGSKVQVSKAQEVYRIMMARSLSNQFTRLVYIPASLVTYFAFKYYKNGVGKSLLDDLGLLTSLRAILMFAKVMAKVKSSINLTHVNMSIDPNDPDPQKTIEMSIHEIIKMRQQYFPLGINSPNDLVDWIQRAGFEFSFEGHPGIPQTKFDFETRNLQHQLPDDELDEMLRKQSYMALGLSPETVDNGFNSEFATSIVANNILMSKRVLQIQEVIVNHMTDYVRKLVLNDYTAREELMEAVKTSKESIDKYLSEEEKAKMTENPEWFLQELMENFVDMLEVSLPKPDMTTIESQYQAYQNYAESLDKALDAWVNGDFIDGSIAGEISGNIEVIKATIRAHFLRKWMAENGFMPELNDIVSADEDGNASLDLYQLTKEHTEGVVRSAVKFIQSMLGTKTGSDNDLQAMGTGSSDTGGSDYGSDSSGDYGGGDDDGFGAGDDLSGDGDENTSDEEGQDTGVTEPEGAGNENETNDKPEEKADKEELI